MTQNVVAAQLLPIIFTEAEEVSKSSYVYEPNQTDIINDLLPMFVENQLYGFYLRI